MKKLLITIIWALKYSDRTFSIIKLRQIRENHIIYSKREIMTYENNYVWVEVIFYKIDVREPEKETSHYI